MSPCLYFWLYYPQVDLEHDYCTYDHPRAKPEIDTLWKIVREDVIPRFFKEIRGTPIICNMLPLNIDVQSRFTAVDFGSQLKLREEVVITPRLQLKWLWCVCVVHLIQEIL